MKAALAECRCSGSNSSRAKLLSHFMQVPTSSVHSSTSFSSSAAAGYRRLLRVSRVVFKDHDVAIKGAREELRSIFYKNKDVTDQEELKKLLVGIDEVEEMLKFNIVQGERNERGNYGKPQFNLLSFLCFFTLHLTLMQTLSSLFKMSN